MKKIEPDTVSIRTLWQAGLKGKVNHYEVEHWYKEAENGKFIRRDKETVFFYNFWDLLAWMERVKQEYVSGGKDW